MNNIRFFWLFVIAGVESGLFFGHSRLEPMSTWLIVEKGAAVGLLALWAGLNARDRDGWLIAAVLVLGALGDVLLETNGMTVGALAFLAGHLVAVALYWLNRGPNFWVAVPVALAVSFIAWLIPADRASAPGIALYALGLGAMAGAAWFSRFPRKWVGLGAVLFVVSDLLIFAKAGMLKGSMLSSLLIWPLYSIGQALIAWGVVWTLRVERRG